jgi:hypothetical protein
MIELAAILGAVFGAIIAGPWWWKAAHADGYQKGIDDANALICGGMDDVTGG